MEKKMQRTEKVTRVEFVIEEGQKSIYLSGHIEKEQAFVKLVEKYKKPLEVVMVKHETYRYTMPVEQFKQAAKVERI